MESDFFPARLRELREAVGLTQPQLAEKVGISPRQVSRLETGAQTATWPTVVALAQALGVDCTAFTQPPASETGTRPRGRPRKEAPGATHNSGSSSKTTTAMSEQKNSTSAKRRKRKE